MMIRSDQVPHRSPDITPTIITWHRRPSIART